MSERGARWRASVITVSDSRARGEIAEDASGDLMAERLAALPATVVSRRLVADSIDQIRSAVEEAVESSDLVVLSGGTGLGPRDQTPQALLPLLDYQVPGMAEAMRQHGLGSTPLAMISRQVVGVVKGCLVMALPGNPRAVAESLDAVWKALPHALALLGGDTRHR